MMTLTRNPAASFSNIEVDLSDPDLRPLRESVRRRGAFAAHGEQFAHHAHFVQMVISRYARLVESIEQGPNRYRPSTLARCPNHGRRAALVLHPADEAWFHPVLTRGLKSKTGCRQQDRRHDNH